MAWRRPGAGCRARRRATVVPLRLRDLGEVEADDRLVLGEAGDPQRGAAVAVGQLFLDRGAELRSLDRVGGDPREVGGITLRRPVGDDHRREARARRDVGVLVGRDLQPRRPCRLDRGTGLLGQAPVLLAGYLEVRDVHGEPGALADVDRLADRAEQTRAFVPDVAGVDPAVGGDDLRELDELVRVGVAAGDVDQARRHAPRPGPHPFFHELFHGPHLGGVGLALGRAQDGLADVALGDQVDDVRAGAVLVDVFKVLVDVERPAPQLPVTTVVTPCAW